jgi:DnaK suppressor protein
MTQKKTKASPTKKAVKKTPAKKAVAVKKTPAKKAVAVKKTPAKKAVAVKKTPAKKASANKESARKAPVKPSVEQASVTRVGAASDKKATPIVFSLDDVEQLVASRTKEKRTELKQEPASKVIAVKPAKKVIIEDKPVEKRVLGAASLADILGFNPAEKKRATNLEEESIPKKWKKYYKLLLELRIHVSSELDLHTADTLKHSSREENGESSYGNHQADAATDSFDHDFALSLVSSEQDALNEVEEAIRRIKDGTYGVCEVTGQSIGKERLEAVPFARYSIEGQAEYEKNMRRKVDRVSGGLFADSTDAPKVTADDDDE